MLAADPTSQETQYINDLLQKLDLEHAQSSNMKPL